MWPENSQASDTALNGQEKENSLFVRKKRNKWKSSPQSLIPTLLQLFSQEDYEKYY